MAYDNKPKKALWDFMFTVKNINDNTVLVNEIYSLDCLKIISSKTARHHHYLFNDLSKASNFQHESATKLSLTNEVAENGLYNTFLVSNNIRGLVGKLTYPLHMSEEEISQVCETNEENLNEDEFSALFLSCMVYGDNHADYEKNKAEAILSIQKNLDLIKEAIKDFSMEKLGDFLNNEEFRHEVILDAMKTTHENGEEYVY